MKLRKYLRDGRAPVPKNEVTSRIMSANRGKGTRPELILKSRLRRDKIGPARYNFSGLVGSPDVVFPHSRVVIFINGCFWHQCPDCELPLPKANKQFWREKFKRNSERDRRILRELRKLRWRTVVVWEHEIKKDLPRTIRKIERALNAAK
jgi:DNA mismatch endonuclease (patch repair protein)